MQMLSLQLANLVGINRFQAVTNAFVRIPPFFSIEMTIIQDALWGSIRRGFEQRNAQVLKLLFPSFQYEK